MCELLVGEGCAMCGPQFAGPDCDVAENFGDSCTELVGVLVSGADDGIRIWMSTGRLLRSEDCIDRVFQSPTRQTANHPSGR